MKVVLFCGGLGMRLRPLSPDPPSLWAEVSQDLPKPMVYIGGRHPLLWHVMKYYAHFGHKDFVLCLGYKAETIKDYFLSYNEYLTNDFVFSQGGRALNLLHSDISDWDITFVDTGLYSSVGERFKTIESYVGNEEVFMANYSDGLSDLPLDRYVEHFMNTDYIGSFICVKPPQTSHVVKFDEDGRVHAIEAMPQAGVWINGGYFLFRKEIFNYIEEGEELVNEPMHRLIAEGKLLAYQYDGFWTCIDTFKEKQELDEMFVRGETPWQVWLQDEAQNRVAG